MLAGISCALGAGTRLTVTASVGTAAMTVLEYAGLSGAVDVTVAATSCAPGIAGTVTSGPTAQLSHNSDWIKLQMADGRIIVGIRAGPGAPELPWSDQ